MNRPLTHILLLEDNPSDAELMQRELRKAGLAFQVTFTQDKASFLAALASSPPDLVLADYSLPGFDGMTAMSLVHERFSEVPVIIVSGAIGEEIAIEALKAGATDYVLKQRLSRIGPVVKRALQEAQQIAERRQAEALLAERSAALRESEERFRLLIEAVEDYAILMLDPSGYITSWNAGAERIKGWTAGEILGRHFSVFYLPEDRESGQPQRALELAAAQGRYEGQGQRLRKDGSRFWADVVITALHDDTGRVRGFAKITQDITGRKQAEEEIIRAKEEWEHTFDTIPDLIAILDNDQHITRANRAMAERLGLPPDRCIGQICYQCVHGLNHTPVFCPHPLTMADGKQHVAEVYEPRLGGYFLVSTNPLRNSAGQITGVVHVARDITRRKQQERALWESEERFRVALAAAPMTVFTCDREGRYSWIYSPRADQKWGDLLGKRDEDLNPAENILELSRAKQYVLESRQTFQNEIKVRWPDGNWSYYVLTLEPIFDADQVIVGMNGSAIETTRQHIIEEENLERRAQMEVQRRLLDYREKERQAIARELHDGPVQDLIALIFNIQLTKEALDDPAIRVELEPIILNLKDIIQDLRATINELRPPSLVLRFGLAKTLWVYLEDLSEKHPEIELEQDLMNDGDCLTEQARWYLFRVAQEALTNAIKHAGATKIGVRLICGERQVTLEVEDNGKGFVVASSLVDYTINGHYGMAGMKERAEAIGGEMVIDSEPGKGTKVQVKVLVITDK